MTARIGVIGDSLALGIAWELGFGTHNVGTEIQQVDCRCKVGASGATIATWPVPQTPVLVVSMGSNNPSTLLAGQLAYVRSRAAADALLMFVLPAKEPGKAAVIAYAAGLHAPTITFVAADALGLHPASYAPLAKAVLAAATTPAPTSDRRKPLFDALRKSVFSGSLSQPQVDGINRILDFAEQRQTPLPWLAYEGATTTLETDHAMQPVEEAFKLEGTALSTYLKGKPYYPYFGRGLVQVTWKANYEKFGITNPDDLCTWPVALRALFDGMEQGLFTGKKLSDYVSADGARCDYVNARRIVNGTDRAAEFASIALLWKAALIACAYGKPAAQLHAAAPAAVATPQPAVEPVAVAPTPAEPSLMPYQPEGPTMTTETPANVPPTAIADAPAAPAPHFVTISIDKEALAAFLAPNLLRIETLIAEQAVAHGVPSFVAAGALSLIGHADLPHWLAAKASEFNVEKPIQVGLDKLLEATAKLLPSKAA